MDHRASRAKCHAGGGPLERRVRAHSLPWPQTEQARADLPRRARRPVIGLQAGRDSMRPTVEMNPASGTAPVGERNENELTWVPRSGELAHSRAQLPLQPA